MDHSAVHFISQIFIILFVSVALGLLSQRFRQSLIMGYILAGVLLGPHTLGWIRDDFEIRQIAEIGLLFLMFSIGLEFSLKKLKTIRRVVFGAGSLQILATVAAGTGLGVLLGFSLPTGIFIGCVMSLSSTAVVSKELKDHAELDSPQGRLSMGILIFQDIAVIPMVIFLPILGTFDQALGQDLAWAGAKLTLFLLFAYVVGRYVFPTILRLIADTGSKELLVLTTLMLAFGMASASQWFGLSIVLGAFVAGILLSETEFNFQLRHIIFPFQEVFMSLFFISIGLLLDVNFLFTHFWQVLLLAIAIPLVNALVCSVVVLIFGYPLRVALFAALILAEIGEFSFVLIHVGATHQLITQEVYQLLLSFWQQ